MAYFAASCDSAEKNKDFAASLDANYPILSDPEKTVAKAFGVVYEASEDPPRKARGFPERWTFFIDKDGKILHITKKVDVNTHGEEIAKQLGELKVAKKKS